MVWICPRCDYSNSDEFNSCNACHLGKLGHETYKEREYICRLKPIRPPTTILGKFFGLFLSASGLLLCIISIVNSNNMTLSLTFFLSGAFFFGIGIYSFLYSMSGHIAMNLLKAGKSVTNAEVLGRYTEEYDAGDNYGGVSVSYYIDIRFNAGEKQYVIKARVDKDIYEKAERGNLLQVTYAISDPRILIFENEQIREY
jgi:hypothetical protein